MVDVQSKLHAYGCIKLMVKKVYPLDFNVLKLFELKLLMRQEHVFYIVTTVDKTKSKSPLDVWSGLAI